MGYSSWGRKEPDMIEQLSTMSIVPRGGMPVYAPKYVLKCLLALSVFFTVGTQRGNT